MPGFGFLIGISLTKGSLLLGYMITRPLLRFDGFTLIGFVHISHEDTHRGTVIDDMMEISKQVEIAFSTDDTDAEEPILQEVEGLYELFLQCFQIMLAHLFGRLLISLIGRHHHRIAVFILYDMRLDETVCRNRLFDGSSQLMFIDGTIDFQQNRVVVCRFPTTGHTLGIDAHLSLGKGNRIVEG